MGLLRQVGFGSWGIGVDSLLVSLIHCWSFCLSPNNPRGSTVPRHNIRLQIVVSAHGLIPGGGQLVRITEQIAFMWTMVGMFTDLQGLETRPFVQDEHVRLTSFTFVHAWTYACMYVLCMFVYMLVCNVM